MQPQLWKKEQTFEEWKLQHQHLSEREAYNLYLQEQRLYEMYLHELRNQQIYLQNQTILENTNLLADSITDILNATYTFAVGGRGNGASNVPLGFIARSFNLELITDEGDALITDEGDFLIT